MTARLNIKYAGHDHHHPSEFIDAIKEYLSDTAPGVKDGSLSMSAESRDFTFRRSGKLFNGVLISALGHVTVIVKEAEE